MGHERYRSIRLAGSEMRTLPDDPIDPSSAIMSIDCDASTAADFVIASRGCLVRLACNYLVVVFAWARHADRRAPVEAKPSFRLVHVAVCADAIRLARQRPFAVDGEIDGLKTYMR